MITPTLCCVELLLLLLLFISVSSYWLAPRQRPTRGILHLDLLAQNRKFIPSDSIQHRRAPLLPCWVVSNPNEEPEEAILKQSSSSSLLNGKTNYTLNDVEWILRSWENGKMVLESWIDDDLEKNDTTISVPSKQERKKKKKVGRFGITVKPGPTHPILLEALEELYNNNNNNDEDGDGDSLLTDTTTTTTASSDSRDDPIVAAIIYMFVEESHRSRNIGTLALQVIRWIQATLGSCSHILLVADDNGSGKLIQWYQAHGFVVVPSLQDFVGSPHAIHGVAMMGTTTTSTWPHPGIPANFSIQLPDDFETELL